MNGVLVIDKPEGPTSHDVVARARRALGLRAIGHTGTLDPMATGVLALVLGRATRLAQFLSGAEKRYDAAVRLGITTDSWDRTGAVLRRAAEEAGLPAEADVRRQIAAMLGEQDQMPPPFSAKKIAGVRAYDLARSGREVAVRPARVFLYRAEVVAYAPPLLQLSVACSAGYYVRGLAHALGETLGCGACLDQLRRVASGGFTLARAVTLESLERDPAEALGLVVPLKELLPELPLGVLNESGARRTFHGNDVGPSDFAGSPPQAGSLVRLLGPDGDLLAIARPGPRPGVLHPAVVLK